MDNLTYSKATSDDAQILADHRILLHLNYQANSQKKKQMR